MSDAFDLTAYFDRIGYGGSAAPALETLSAIHARHVASIPFETLDPLMGRPVVLDLDALQAKLVQKRRGGYCFEQNALFMGALRTMGYSVTGLAGRVRWMSPPDAPFGPRSHMLLRVDLPEGPFLADVGFGAHLLDAPLRLEPDVEQATPLALYRFSFSDGVFGLQVRQADGWRIAYMFTLEPQFASDYVMSNWFTSTHPQSLFISTLLAERLTAEARFNLINNRLTERYHDGRVVERTLSDAEAFGEALDQVFNLEPPVPAEAVFAKLPTI
ncbi:MAG: arylamine N-acetyltransferase [Caulobacterales bacterium]